MHTAAASGAFIPVYGDPAILKSDSLLRADAHAMMTAGAFSAVPHDFRFCCLTFRICAPSASQGTAFQENNCPDAGTVIEGEFLNVEYNAVILFHI
jgi:hypothetical protein